MKRTINKRTKDYYWGKFKNYLGIEIGIEYKACLYFFAMMFFCCCYCFAMGRTEVPMRNLAEMILTNYVMCYLQMYLFWNFDEAQKLGGKEGLAVILCTAIYSGLSFGLKWFDRNQLVTMLFAFYVAFLYLCMILINRIKREYDTKQLNDMLTAYKKGGRV